MMSIPVGQEWSGLNSIPKKVQFLCVQTTPKGQMESKRQQQQQQGLAMALATKICLMPSTCPEIPSSVPRALKQDQCDNRMSTCGGLVDSAYKDGTFLSRIHNSSDNWPPGNHHCQERRNSDIRGQKVR
jgi:hypothetical protein